MSRPTPNALLAAAGPPAVRRLAPATLLAWLAAAGPPAVRRLAPATLLAWLAVAGPAIAQDFTSAQLAGPGASACALIERGLPGAAPGVSLEACFARWLALPDLETRAVACAAGWRLARVAAGVSQTGEPDLGWSAAGLACGVAGAEGGAAVRALARRDRTIVPGSAAAERLEARAGVEVGGGAWLEAAPGLRLWASAPQLWMAGTAPPLERPLEIGVVLERDGLAAWLSRAAPTGDTPPDHAAGLALRSGPLLAWGTVRDRPLRGGLGVAARARGLTVAAEVEGHPDLGETVRLSFALSRLAPPTASGGEGAVR